MTWESASTPQRVVYTVLVELLLDDIVRFHSGVGLRQWNGFDWAGVGDLGSLSAIQGGTELEASDIELTLSGVPSDYRADLLNDIARGKRVNIFHGFWNDAAGSWAYEPELAYAGFVDESVLDDVVSEGGEASVSIMVRIMSAAAYGRRLMVSRRTDAHQQDLYAGDKFFSFKTDLRVPVATPRGASQAVIRGFVRGAFGQTVQQ